MYNRHVYIYLWLYKYILKSFNTHISNVHIYMDKLDFQAYSLATTEEESCYVFKVGPLITSFFPWSLVKSEKRSFKIVGLGFQYLAGENQHIYVLATIYNVTNSLVNVFKALKKQLDHMPTHTSWNSRFTKVKHYMPIDLNRVLLSSSVSFTALVLLT